MHEPIWKVDLKLFRAMIVPYVLGIGSTLIASIGVIGLIELAYFMSTRSTAATEKVLYGFNVDAATVVPWAICLGIAVVGIEACRRTYPPMSASYNTAIAAVKARMAM